MSATPVLRTFVQYLIAFCSPPEAASEVISGVVVDPIRIKFHVKLGDSRSNRSRDIRVPHFVTNDVDGDDDTNVRRSSNKGPPMAFCLKCTEK